MSRSQQAILGVLGVAIVLVYGSLGAYGLIYLIQPVRTLPGQSAQALNPPGGAASPTPGLPGIPTTVNDGSSPGQPLPTNTRVIPLGSPGLASPTPEAAAPPAGTPLPASTGPASPAASPQPTHSAVPAPPPPQQATPTVEPSPTSPPPSPTPDTSCVDDENALHLQLLADIATLYEPILSWIEDEMEQAERDRDEMRLEELQLEYDMNQNMKATDIAAENARHEAALAACNP
jgi:hypothetical protein